MAVEYKGEKLGVLEMRKHISWYLKGMRNANIIKNTINKMDNKEEIKITLLDYLEKEYN